MENYPWGVTDKDIDEFWGGPSAECTNCYFYSNGVCSIHDKLTPNCDDFEKYE